MQGIDLSRRFFFDVVQPWLGEVAPELGYSAALLGYGSELLGFDDAMSRDHNWGPRVHILFTRADFEREASRLVSAFSDVAPTSFLGEPIGWRSRPHPPANGPDAVGALEHGLEIHTLEGALGSHVALPSVEALSNLDWLGFAEQKLLAFTAGAVFHDDDNRLGRARDILAYYPDDVWLYKIACQWRRIAEEQAFVGRTAGVGDDLGSRVIAARLARDVMAMGFLLDRRYAPYAKWFGSGFARLPIAPLLQPHLERALLASTGTERGDALAQAYLALAQRQNALGIARFAPVLGLYYERPFTTINADDAVEAAHEAIVDPAIRRLPIVGTLDQVTDLTPVLASPALSRKMMQQLLD